MNENLLTRAGRGGRNLAVTVLTTMSLSACCMLNPSQCRVDTGIGNATDGETFNLFQKELAGKIAARVGDNDKFAITPMLGGAYPVGTLMPYGRTINIEIQDICEIKQPAFYPYDFGMTSFDLSQGVALDAGLEQAVGPIATAEASLNDKRKISLNLSDASIQQLTTTDLDNLLNDKKCVSKISDKRIIMVRGYIQAKRSFTAHLDKNGKLKVGISKLAKFDANFDDGTQTLTLNDPSPFKFLQIVSEINVTAPQNGAKPVMAVSSTLKSSIPANPGKLYIQIDAQDTSSRVEEVQAALKSSFEVASGIERIPSTKMPSRSQVRYFNVDDEGKAKAALALVQQTDPNATARYVGLPAPTGQLEVWLTRK